jgi:RNA polymerase sigma factor (sigma-70 family)
MTGDSLTAAVQRLQALAGAAALEGVADGQVLERFAAHGEEVAFAALVRRHGPMVLGVCRRFLPNAHDAEDAFQATFLVLARSAGSIGKRDSVASWLYGVALRVARRARANEARRQGLVPPPPASGEDPLAEASRRELRGIVDEELGRLPARFRRPLVLCYLEGRSHPEAARELGCPVGTVRSRLARGRELLRGRLTRRGLAGAAGVAAMAGQALAAPVPPHLLVAAVRGGMDWAAGRAAGSPAAAALAEGAARALAGHRAAALAAVLVLLTALATAAGWVVFPRSPAPTPPDRPHVPEGAAVQVMDFNGDPLPPHALARLGTARLRHGSHVRFVALSADGAVAASAGDDGTVRVWDAATGRERFRRPGYGGAALSPDGKVLAAVGFPQGVCTPVYLIDVATGRELGEPFPASPSERIPVVFSPDGRLVAIEDSARVHFWDATTGKKAFECPAREIQAEGATGLAFSPDGKTVAVSAPRGVALWDTATRQQAGLLPVAAAALAFSPDGKTLVAAPAGLSSAVLFYDPATGRELRRLNAVVATSLAFTPDGQSLLVGGPGYVKLLNVITGAERWSKGETLENGRRDPVTCFALAADGKTFVTGYQMTTVVRLWETATGKELDRPQGHEWPVQALAFAPDGKTVASAAGEPNVGTDPRLRFWHAASGKPLPDPLGDVHACTGLAYSPDGRFLAGVLWEEGKVVLWDTTTWKKADEFTDRNFGPRCVAFSPDGRRLAVGGYSPVHVWETATGRLQQLPEPAAARQRPPGDTKAPAAAVSFTADGKTVTAAGYRWGTTWDAASGEQRKHFDFKVGLPLFSPDGGLLAVLMDDTPHPDDVARVLAADTGEEVTQLREARWFRSVTFSPDGKRLATGHGDGAVRVWDAATGKELQKLVGHQGPVTVLAFSPDGRTLATGSTDTTVLLWDVGRP